MTPFEWISEDARMPTLLDVAEVLRVRDGYRISWYDAQRTILLTEFFGKWTWEEALEDTRLNMEVVQQQPHGVYALLVLQGGGASLPTSGSAFKNLRALWQFEAENERYIILVMEAHESLFGRFLSMMQRIYNGKWSLGKTIFIRDLGEALAFIERDKQMRSLPPT